MAGLTYGERAVRCLAGEDADRTPYGVGLGWSPWWETLQRWKEDTGDPNLDPAAQFGFEPSFAVAPVVLGPYPVFARENIEETEEYVVLRDDRGILMRCRKDGGSMPEFLDYPVKTPQDWERLKAERFQFHLDRLPANWDEFRTRLAATGEAVQVGVYPYGVFGAPRDLMGAEEVLLAFYTEPAMVKDMMRHLTDLWISVWERVADALRIDHIHIWEDMSGRQGSLISPAMVEEFMMPCYDRIAAFARAHDVRLVSVDTDGDCSELVPLMTRHGVNVFFPFEVQAGNDILDYRAQYPDLGILGGLDKRALAGSRADVDREMDKAAEMVQQGRYIPGFDHLIPPDATWENFAYVATRMRSVCGL